MTEPLYWCQYPGGPGCQGLVVTGDSENPIEHCCEMEVPPHRMPHYRALLHGRTVDAIRQAARVEAEEGFDDNADAYFALAQELEEQYRRDTRE